MARYQIPESQTSRATKRPVSDAAAHYGRRDASESQVRGQSRRKDISDALQHTEITDASKEDQTGIGRTVTRGRVQHAISEDTTVPADDLKGLRSITSNVQQDQGVGANYWGPGRQIQTGNAPAQQNPYGSTRQRRSQDLTERRASYGHLLAHEIGHHVDETHGPGGPSASGLASMHSGEVEARGENYADKHAPQYPYSAYDAQARVNSPMAPWNQRGQKTNTAGISGNDRYKTERGSGNLPGRDEPVLGRNNKTYTPEEQSSQIDAMYSARSKFKPLDPGPRR